MIPNKPNSIRASIRRLRSRSGLLAIIAMALGFSLIETGANANAWTAKSIATEADASSRVLWVRYDNAMGIWSFNSSGVETLIGTVYGPYTTNGSDWHAMKIGAAPGGAAMVLWTRDDGAAGLWKIGSNGVVASIGPTYGPYSDSHGSWKAVSLGTSPSGSIRVLWTRSDGAYGLWSFNTSGYALEIGSTYGPTGDFVGPYAAVDIGTANDGSARVLFTRSDNAFMVLNFDASDGETSSGPLYGPYADGNDTWKAIQIGLDPTDDTSRVLWQRSDSALRVWSYDAAGNFALSGPDYGPYPDFDRHMVGGRDRC